MRKWIVIGGFAGGALMGTAALNSARISSGVDGPTQAIAGQPASSPETAALTAAPPTASQPATVSPAPSDAALRMAAFQQLATQVANGQGGKISLRQLMAIAQVTGAEPPGMPVIPGGLDARRSSDPDPAGDMLTRMFQDQALHSGRGYADRMNMPLSPDSLDSGAGRYTGSSGAHYEYDLNNPGDQIRYSTDVAAQLRDQTRGSIDPRVDIDQGLGQYGGGVEPH